MHKNNFTGFLLAGCAAGAVNGLLGGGGKTKIKNRLLPAAIPAAIVALLTILGIASSGIAGILMIVMIPVTILCARIFWKKGLVKVIPAEEKK